MGLVFSLSQHSLSASTIDWDLVFPPPPEAQTNSVIGMASAATQVFVTFRAFVDVGGASKWVPGTLRASMTGMDTHHHLLLEYDESTPAAIAADGTLILAARAGNTWTLLGLDPVSLLPKWEWPHEALDIANPNGPLFAAGPSTIVVAAFEGGQPVVIWLDLLGVELGRVAVSLALDAPDRIHALVSYDDDSVLMALAETDFKASVYLTRTAIDGSAWTVSVNLEPVPAPPTSVQLVPATDGEVWVSITEENITGVGGEIALLLDSDGKVLHENVWCEVICNLSNARNAAAPDGGLLTAASIGHGPTSGWGIRRIDRQGHEGQIVLVEPSTGSLPASLDVASSANAVLIVGTQSRTHPLLNQAYLQERDINGRLCGEQFDPDFIRHAAASPRPDGGWLIVSDRVSGFRLRSRSVSPECSLTDEIFVDDFEMST